MDLITLDINGTVLERLDSPTDEAQAGELADANGAQDDENDEDIAGPIAIAVDVNEAPANETTHATSDNPAL